MRHLFNDLITKSRSAIVSQLHIVYVIGHALFKSTHELTGYISISILITFHLCISSMNAYKVIVTKMGWGRRRLCRLFSCPFWDSGCPQSHGQKRWTKTLHTNRKFDINSSKKQVKIYSIKIYSIKSIL